MFLSEFSQQLLDLGKEILCTLSGRQSVLCKWILRWKSSLRLYSNFQFFLLSLLYNTYGLFSSKFSQKQLDLGLWNLWQVCLFSESVTNSDGYCRGCVSFAHSLLYFQIILNTQQLSLFLCGVCKTYPCESIYCWYFSYSGHSWILGSDGKQNTA